MDTWILKLTWKDEGTRLAKNNFEKRRKVGGFMLLKNAL